MKDRKTLLKRVLSVICSFSIILLSVYFNHNEVYAATTDEMAAYVKSLVGTPAKEWGSAYSTQCVELSKYYVESYFGIPTKKLALGNGNKIYINIVNLAPDKFTRIDYYQGFVPQAGDIISYHSASAPAYGHTAVVYEGGATTYKIAEQWAGSGTVRGAARTVMAPQYGKNYTIIGVARPKCEEPVPVEWESVQKNYTVCVSQLNFRESYGTGSPKIEGVSLTKGDIVYVTESAVISGETWAHIVFGEWEGYCCMQQGSNIYLSEIIAFPETAAVPGDVNNDGLFDSADAAIFQKWLLAVPDITLANWKAADFCDDDKLDIFDLCLMKQALIEQMQN